MRKLKPGEAEWQVKSLLRCDRKKLEGTAAIPGLVSYRRSLSCCTHHYNSTACSGTFSFTITNYYPVLISPSVLHECVCVCVCVLVAQSCLTLCDPMYCSLPGSSVHGILQARILEWVAIPFCRRSSQPRDRTWVSCISGSLPSEPLGKPPSCMNWHYYSELQSYQT